jgi:glutathione S-transferase
MLEIWGRRTSSNVQALMWCVSELDLPYQRHDVGHHYGGTVTPEFLALNPNGTVPVLRDGGGEPLWETGAILRYLASRYGTDAFWPHDAGQRARVDKWAEWAKLNIALNFTGPVFGHVVRTPTSRRDPERLAEALAVLGRFLDIAERQLKLHPYLAGDHLTLADIQFGHVLYRYFDIAIPREDRPNLRRYFERLARRPAFGEHVMVSYEELRATGE